MRVDLNHPEFVQPDADATIWRYMSFAKFVSLLNHKALFFSRISALPDASEGRLPRRNLQEWDAHVIASCEYARNTAALNCWHMRNGESWAMWQAYCGLTEGVAIKSTYKRLTESFQSVEGSLSNLQVVAIGMVRYLDFEADLLASSNGYAPLMCKRNVFEDDREVRAVIVPDTFLRSAFEQNSLLGLYMPVDLMGLVDAVVVAPEAATWMLDLVRLLVGGSFPVKRSSIALARRPDTLREIALVKKIETEFLRLKDSNKLLESDARHQIALSAMGHGFVYKDQAEFLEYRREQEFVYEYTDWLINNGG